MQLKHVIRPAALFAAGSLASGAHAAAVDIAATDAGTGIFLFGSQTAQFTYDYDAAATADSTNKYYLRSAPGTTNVGPSVTATGFPDANSNYVGVRDMLVTTTTSPQTFLSNFNPVGFRVVDDAGVTRYGRATASTTGASAGRITDISINGLTDFYVGTTAQQVSAAVPEPATWATAVIGLGLAGAAMRRRRRDGLAQPAPLAA